MWIDGGTGGLLLSPDQQLESVNALLNTSLGRTVCVTGWQQGAATISAMQALRDASGVGLAVAKQQVERCLAGEPVEVLAHDCEAADRLVERLFDCGFTARRVADR